MKKNIASQVIGVQMVSATDGSAFTGSVTVYVTGDGGTQAVGSVGSGACTHEGNGFHTYVPAQAETNYDHVAFTFIGTGAVPATVQVYTTYPQTGDGYARLGAPAGASIAADIATVDGVVDNILTDTAEIGAAGAGLTAVPWNSSWDAEVQSECADALTAYDPPTKAELDSGLAALNDPTAAAIADAVLDEALSGHTTAGTLGKAVADIETDAMAILADTNELQTDDVPGLISALNDIAASDILTTQLTESYATDGTAPTLSQAIFLIQQFLYERATSGTTVTVKKLDGATTAATLTLDDGTSPTSITRSG